VALWRDDADARQSWHLYHLIGDVMRSDDLAAQPSRDTAFLEGLRSRLASEPVPLAPAPVPAAPPLGRRLGWRAPVAVAAGFVAVAATLVLTRPQSLGFGDAVGIAGAPGSTAGHGVRAVLNPQPSATGALVADGRMIRDPRLDAYLQAHQPARSSSLGVMPGVGLRSAELLVTPLSVTPASPKANASAPDVPAGQR
jgi:sigma-E factor negative regulatory protein RseA